MAFTIHTTESGRVPSLEYLPAGAITPKVGMALTITDGVLALATGKPRYISMCEWKTACTNGTRIPVLRVLPDMTFETTWSVNAAAVSCGEKVTLSADAMQVTATTAGGVAEVIGRNGSEAGDSVRVRFS